MERQLQSGNPGAAVTSLKYRWYDSQSEVLTSSGWLPVCDVSFGDRLATAVDGSVQFYLTTATPEVQIRHSSYHVTSQQVDLLVPTEQDLLVSHRATGKDRKQFWTKPYMALTKNVMSSTRKYVKAAKYDSQGIPLPCSAQLLGFFLGDGHSTGTQTRFHLKRPRKISYLTSIYPTVRKGKNNQYLIESPSLAKFFREKCYTTDNQKTMPNGFMEMSPEQREGLLDGLKNSDGSLKRNTWVYDTSSKYLADQIQAIGHTFNLVVSVNLRASLDHYTHNYAARLNFSNRLMPEVGTSQKGRSNTTTEGVIVEPIQYYGLQCPEANVLFIRRNNKVVLA